MKWQRAGRVAAVALAVCTAAALYLGTREREVRDRPEVPAEVDPVAISQSGAGVELNYVHDVERWRLSYERRLVYPDHIVFREVHILFKEDGTEVRADQASVYGGRPGASQPKSLTAEGHVRFKTGEGAIVEGEELAYNEETEVSRMPGPVSFTRGRASGTGTDAVYERHAGVFRLLADAHVTLGAGPAEAAQPETDVDATADSLVFNNANRAMLFEGNARITRDVDLMTADAATLYLSEDEQQFQVIELRGNAKVVPGAGGSVEMPESTGEPGARPPAPAGAGSATPDMRARDIDLAFYPGTQALERAVLSQQARLVQMGAGGRRSIEGNVITFSTAPDGATLTHLEAREQVVVVMPPSASAAAREIRAATLVAGGNDREGLTDAVFSGGVEFTERVLSGGSAGSERSGTARTLTLELAGQLDAIDAARFQQDVTFRDGTVTGVADLGAYDLRAGVLRLEPRPGSPERLPRVTDGTMRVDATRFIEVNLETHDLEAAGDVKTQSQRTETTSPSDRAALFDGPEPVFGFGDQFWYQQARRQVRYTGTETTTARLRQGESEVRGDELVLDEQSNDLRATGRVESTLPIGEPAPTTPGSPPAMYRATAETMVYVDQARTVEYEGTPVTLQTPDGRTTAARIVLTLADQGRKLERMVATSDPADPLTADVRSTLSGGRESLSVSLIYDAAADRYTLQGGRGRAVLLQTREQDGTCSTLRGSVGYFWPSTSRASFPDAENPGGTLAAGNQPCKVPLTR